MGFLGNLFGKKTVIECAKCGKRAPKLGAGVVLVNYGKCGKCGKTFCDTCGRVGDDAIGYCPEDGEFLSSSVTS